MKMWPLTDMAVGDEIFYEVNILFTGSIDVVLLHMTINPKLHDSEFQDPAS